MVTADIVKCQFLYELQGNIYLNSDVKGILDDMKVEVSGKRQVDSLEGLESNLN